MARRAGTVAGVVALGVGLSLVVFGTGARAQNGDPSPGAQGQASQPTGNGPLGKTGGTPYNDTALTPEQLNGRQLFVQTCSACHGVDAEGTARAPTPTGLGPATVDFWVRTGRMPLAKPTEQALRKPPLLSATQAREIAEYVASLAPGGVPIPKPDPAGANLQQGGELFRLNCATCHSFVGVGGALSYGAYAPSLKPDTPIDIAEAIRTGPGNMPRFSTAQMSDKDMNDIIRYVRYITRPDDRGGLSLGHVGPTTEGFVGIVFGVGLMMVAAFWIGDRAKPEPAAAGHGHE
jgi:ubiquinol-cytochrome c reductase cytochrome c subunit